MTEKNADVAEPGAAERRKPSSNWLRRAANWLFRNRTTGEITIAQWPNAPLVVFAVAAVAARLVSAPDALHTAFTVISTVALAAWSVLEIWKGVNPWRRLLGAA